MSSHSVENTMQNGIIFLQECTTLEGFSLASRFYFG